MEADRKDVTYEMLYFGLEVPKPDTSVATDDPKVYTNDSDESNTPLNPPVVEDIET